MIEEQDNQPVVEQDEQNELEDYRQQFGLPAHEDVQEDESDVDDSDIDDVEEPDEDQNQDDVADTAHKLRIKYNGEDKELSEEEAITLAQKGMNYDKVQERLTKQQDALDRTARIHGYKDHSDYLDNLDTFEQQQLERQRQTHTQLEENLLAELENAGVDREQAKAYLEQHPAISAGREAIQQREQAREIELQKQREQEESAGWEELLKTYPDLASQVQDGRAPWMTEDMLAKIKRGYSPIDAYEILNRDELMKAQRKRAEQDVLKSNRLNRRAEPTRGGKGDYEKQATSELKSAFAQWGLNPERANKYAK